MEVETLERPASLKVWHEGAARFLSRHPERFDSLREAIAAAAAVLVIPIGTPGSSLQMATCCPRTGSAGASSGPFRPALAAATPAARRGAMSPKVSALRPGNAEKSVSDAPETIELGILESEPNMLAIRVFACILATTLGSTRAVPILSNCSFRSPAIRAEPVVQYYVDRDSGPEARDFTGGSQTYDRHDGTDFRLPSSVAAAGPLGAVRRQPPALYSASAPTPPTSRFARLGWRR